MARISEFEQSNQDSVEVAISAAEYANLGTGPGQLQLKVGAFTKNGADYGAPQALSTNQADWKLDPDTGEYVFVLLNKFYQHNGNYQGIALASVNSDGDAVEVYDAYMIGTFGVSDFDFNTTADTVTSSTWIPVGTEFTDIQQGNPINPPGGDGSATLRWDAPDIDNPVVQVDSGLGDTGTAPPCFTRGTKIATAVGARAIEDLQEGDLVLTRDNGLQAIRWIGSVTFSAVEMEAQPNLRPIRIRANVLGANTPEKDLEVSPQHRILVRSKIAQHMFGTDEVLIGAKHLSEVDGIDAVEDAEEVEYFHMLFDKHEIVISNGAETESLFVGPQALKSVGAAARKEILTLFPELRDPDTSEDRIPVRPLITGRKGRQLVMRHSKNSRGLVF